MSAEMNGNDKPDTDESTENAAPETGETEANGEDNVHAFRSTEDLAEDSLPEDEDEITEVAVLRDEVAALKDKLLRAVAESENVRRRAERDKVDATKFGITRFARDLMSVADNFQRALTSINDDSRATGGETLNNLIMGIEMTEKELLSAFEKNGVKPIAPQPGDKFDPNYHQAMAEVPVNDYPNGSIVHITQTGYVLDDRLLRPAMVTVAKNPDAAAPDASEAADEGDKPADPGSNVNTTA